MPCRHPRTQPAGDDLDQSLGILELGRVPNAVEQLEVDARVTVGRALRRGERHQPVEYAVHEQHRPACRRGRQVALEVARLVEEQRTSGFDVRAGGFGVGKALRRERDQPQAQRGVESRGVVR